MLSDSTEDYDRARKFEHYRSQASLPEYVLVAQDKVHVEQFQRQCDGRWMLSETRRREDAVRLSSLDCDLALREVYDKVDLPTEPSTGVS